MIVNMRTKYIFSKIKQYFFIFSLIALFTFSIFPCHIALAKAISPAQTNLVKNGKIIPTSSHYSPLICHAGRTTLINQNNFSILSSNKTSNKNKQKLVQTSINITPSNFDLTRQRNGPLSSSDDLLANRASQILTVVKIE